MHGGSCAADWLDPERLVRLAERLGASEAEATVSCARRSRVDAHAGEVARATSADTIVVGVRVALGKRVAGAGGEARSMGQAEEIVARAIKLARATREDPHWPGFNPRVGCAGERPPTFDEQVASLDAASLAGMMREEIRVASELGGRVVEAVMSVSSGAELYANSYGGPVRSESTGFAYWLETRVDGEGGHATYGDHYMGVRLDTGRIRRATVRSVERARDALRARQLREPLRGVSVVLEPGEASLLIDTLIVPAISALNIRRGRSPLAGRLGERVLSEELSIVDDPFLPLESGSACADDEGHPTMRKSVFRDGVFEIALYDHYTASLEGRESTGNGFRGEPHSAPSPGPTNLVVEYRGPARSVDELVREAERGVLVASTIGGWLSNPASGQINATVTLGYIIEGGEIREPFKGSVLGGNIYEILGQGLIGVGSDRECQEGVCTGSIAARGASLG